ncbi:MAG TPA: GspH/FimT family pseudopilin [Candidatus Polarisedimenticolaceae bacterium]|nr:GspH/FimT family pseudopilin [Candidatus Polarisedimenticolaceae bacterium]
MRESDPVARRFSRGVTLPELLVVVSIISMAVAIAVPLIGSAIRSASARAATNGFAVNLRAARMIAVSNNTPVSVEVHTEPHPDCFCTPTFYEYPDRAGTMRRFEMPRGITIAASTDPIVFLPNGSLPGGALTEIRVDNGDAAAEVWTVQCSVAGITSVVRVGTR